MELIAYRANSDPNAFSNGWPLCAKHPSRRIRRATHVDDHGKIALNVEGMVLWQDLFEKVSSSSRIGNAADLLYRANKKKPTWPHTLGYSTTPAYSLTSLPGRPVCPSFNHPTNSSLSIRCATEIANAPY
jgi:hypothetical protein